MISVLNMDLLLKEQLRYLDKHLLNRLFFIMIFGSAPVIMQQAGNGLRKSKQDCITLVHLITATLNAGGISKTSLQCKPVLKAVHIQTQSRVDLSIILSANKI